MSPLWNLAVLICAVVTLLGLAWLLHAGIYQRWENGWRRCRKCQCWHNKHGEIRHFIHIEESDYKPIWTLCPKCNLEKSNQ